MSLVILLLALAQPPAVTVVRCSLPNDPHARVYELQRSGDGERARWTMVMRSREAGSSAVVLPLPDARPGVTDREVTLQYRTLNGGRTITMHVVDGGRATLDVYTNFELEVNVEADLDPRVELMNTEGPLTGLTCARGATP